MDNNKPAIGQHWIGRGRGEEKGISDKGMGCWREDVTYSVGDGQTDRQSCHKNESERIQEEAWLYGVPQCETCQPQGPTQRWTQ